MYRPNMASLQRYSSHGSQYWRIVESYRRPDGKPTVRVLAHLGKAEDLLARLEQSRAALRVRSVSSGAVDTAWNLAQELGCAAHIDQAIGSARLRDGLSVGLSLTAAAIARLVHPCSKRAVPAWAATTSLPDRLGVRAEVLTSQHFWDQMDRVPVSALAAIEQRIVAQVLQAEALGVDVLAYDTTNFYTHIDSTNARSQLAERGHNKQRRHDLRQLGLALVVSREGQIPLAHHLYPGAQADVRSFAKLLDPLRKHLRGWSPQPEQLTLVFDQGAESAANLAEARDAAISYVTALKPSHHKLWLHEDAPRLESLNLSGGACVRACRTLRPVHGVEHTVVTVFSETLYEGQRRGLAQSLAKALAQLAKLSSRPRDGRCGMEQRIRHILNRQYLREVLSCTLQEHDGKFTIQPRIDAEARQRLETEYFGLRLIASTRHEWSSAQIIEAYRGQSRVENSFRDLKDPWVAAFRPQFHWTDQKLRVHALIAVLALLLGRVLLRRAQQRAAFQGSLRALITQLGNLRTATVIEQQPGRGRPTASQKLEDADPADLKLLRSLQATRP